ncbi:hypothetical protein ND748_30765, partial [Frankia sp. AiPs1]
MASNSKTRGKGGSGRNAPTAAKPADRPAAGAAGGPARTRAVEQSDGTWHIEGVKRFITSGD